MKWCHKATAFSIAAAMLLALTVATVRCGPPPATASGKSPVPAKQGITDTRQFRIGPSDRCPVCGMFPARYRRHAAAMVFKDGRTYYFCSNGCLLQAWMMAPIHLGAPARAVGDLWVQDYFSGAVIDARKAWWVAGSDVIGPMGRAFVALTTPDAVEAFKARHGGRRVFRLKALDRPLFDALFE